MNIDFVSLLISGLVASATVTTILWLWPDALPATPEAGERGRCRKQALDTNGLFRRIEPFIRALAVQSAALPLNGWRTKIEKRLIAAGSPLGLSGDEFVAVSILTGAAGALLGWIICGLLAHGPGGGMIVGSVFGSAVPWFKIDDICRKRIVTICRTLPHAIDLVALSMKAGLDFPGALLQVNAQMVHNSPLKLEFEHVLHCLSLGWSRQAALKELGERVQARPVRQFVGAVTQAEKRGTPLARVLSTQAEVMRRKRSEAAEQAAARAAVLILGPLMLIFACVFIILLGPFAIKFIRGEML